MNLLTPLHAAKAFLLRWQDQLIQLPFLVVIALVVWLVVGALDATATATSDSLAVLAVLPILTAYALAAAAITYMIRRRWRRKLDEHEQYEWWQSLVHRSKPGAIVVYVTDSVFTLCVFIACLLFFSQAL